MTAARAYGSVEIGRLVAAVLVVSIHAAPLYPYAPDLNHAMSHGVARLAVPFFFVVTGYFSADPLARDRWRWERRIGAMYLVWCLVYAPMLLINSPDAATALGHLLLGFRHLWYLPALLAAGLTLSFAARLGPRFLVPMAVGLYLLGAGLEYTLNGRWEWGSLPAPELSAQIARNFLTFAFPFMALGHVMRTTGAGTAIWARPGWASLALAAAIVAFAAEYAFAQHLFGPDRMADIYVVLIVLVPLVFAGLLRLPARPIALPLGKIATSVYLTHVYLIAIGHTYLGLDNLGMFVFGVAGGAALTPLLIRLSRYAPFL